MMAAAKVMNRRRSVGLAPLIARVARWGKRKKGWDAVVRIVSARNNFFLWGHVGMHLNPDRYARCWQDSCTFSLCQQYGIGS